MIRILSRTTFFVAALALCAGLAGAQQGDPASGPRAEALRLIDDAATKLVRLAEAMPAEKYTWRPGEGVRSVSELYLHIAAGNFNIPNRFGTPPPEGFNARGYDTSTTDKAKVVDALRKSFEHVRSAVLRVADADIEKTSPWFGGRQASYREIIFFLATHQHEHLGQAIAYARVNGVVPPWTAERGQ